MSKSFMLLLALLVSTVVTSAFLVERWLLRSNVPTIELNYKQLQKLISSCESNDEQCHLLSGKNIDPQQLYLSNEVKQEVLEKGILLLSNDEQQMLLLKLRQGFFQISLPSELMAIEERNEYGTIAFYLLNTFLLLMVLLPLYFTLHKLNKQAQKVSKTGYPEPINIAYPTMLSPLISSFNAMVNKLHQTIDLQRELSATVCHEMRTPLSKISFINAMMEDVPLERTKQQLSKITDDMQLLVDEYLKFSKQEHQYSQIKIIQQNMYELLNESCEKFQEHIQASISLECNLRQQAVFENRSLARAINNLLSNAAKYCHTKIAVSFVEEKHFYVLTVEDDGQGFKNLQPQYLPFQQGQQAIEGYGLGLAIVRRVMDWHQGRITLSHSDSLGGAKVSLEWPKLITAD
ncbi:HAMP domain-containing histidine kinase [Shewanella sp. 202IG2-18]|uniref:ATP-binding protein n=1 Tax=Parashewanella hymeniacidonis TaxID=2807618 RepID=UPI001961AB99|nr:HAMP domain-containing histidine kinase [Parashewanella hymeniacidonis]